MRPAHDVCSSGSEKTAASVYRCPIAPGVARAGAHLCGRHPVDRQSARRGSRRAQGLSRLAASSRPPEGPGLDWPEHGGTLKRIGLEAAAIGARTSHRSPRQVLWKLKPLILREIHAAGNTRDCSPVSCASGPRSDTRV